MPWRDFAGPAAGLRASREIRESDSRSAALAACARGVWGEGDGEDLPHGGWFWRILRIAGVAQPAGRPGDETRALRGGAWNNDQDNARCAVRNRNHPHNRNDNVGFRVLCSSHVFPFPPGHGYLHKFENRLKMGGMDLKICDLNLG